MKKLLFILLASFAFCATVETTFSTESSESILRTNTLNSDGGRGAYVNTTVARTGYAVMIQKTKPTDNIMVTGNLVLYADVSTGSVGLMWIAKDVAGTITSGSVTGI